MIHEAATLLKRLNILCLNVRIKNVWVDGFNQIQNCKIKRIRLKKMAFHIKYNIYIYKQI